VNEFEEKGLCASDDAEAESRHAQCPVDARCKITQCTDSAFAVDNLMRSVTRAVTLLNGGPVATQFKATQLVVAMAVWATQRSDPDFNLSILLLNDASEQYYITIGWITMHCFYWVTLCCSDLSFA
jgi:hypothetical protein